WALYRPGWSTSGRAAWLPSRRPPRTARKNYRRETGEACLGGAPWLLGTGAVAAMAPLHSRQRPAGGQFQLRLQVAGSPAAPRRRSAVTPGGLAGGPGPSGAPRNRGAGTAGASRSERYRASWSQTSWAQGRRQNFVKRSGGRAYSRRITPATSWFVLGLPKP